MGKEIILKDKTKIYYKEYGHGEDLFLLHGNDGDMTYFEYQIGYLSRYFHLILIDFRDHGFSTNEKNKLNFELLASDLKEVYDQLGIKQASLLGFSDGANLCLVFHKLYPAYVNKMILNAPNARFKGITLPAKILMVLENIFWTILPFFKRNKRVARLLLSDLEIELDDLRNIDNDTLILAGSNDLIRISHIKKIAKNIDGAKLVIVKNQGHRLARTAPEIFNKLVYDFLEGRLWKKLKNINKICLIFYFWY